MASDPFDITGKVAIITGGGTGIGEGIAEEFVRRGASVAIASRNADHINPVAERLSKESGRDVLAVATDVRKQEDLENLVEQTVKKFGTITTVVNNHGASFTVDAAGLSLNGWNTIVGINLGGSFLLSRLCHPHLKEAGGGTVIMISSTAGRDGSAKMAHYGAAKAGVINLAKSLAMEWAADKIRVNCISPGPIITQGIVDVFGLKSKENAYKRWGTGNTIGHAGWPEDIAWGCVYLASEASRFITGHNIDIDGGPHRSVEAGQ